MGHFWETLLMVVLAIIFPPLPVLLETGCSGQLLLNIVLTILGWLPGVVHAIYISFKVPHEKRYGLATTTAGAPYSYGARPVV